MSVELAVNIANTAAFIAADPSVVDIKRDTWISDGAGGRKRVTPAIDVALQLTVRMVPQGADNATSNPITQTTNGSLDRPDFVMIALPGVALQRNDYFDWQGETWEILTLRRTPNYEIKADVSVQKDV